MEGVQGGMECGGDAGEAFEEGWRGGVEEFVGDAEDAVVANGGEMLPVALSDDAFEGDSIPCSAPGEEEDFGLGGFGEAGDGVCGGVSAGFAEEGSAGGFDQFGDPVLGVDEGFAPLFAVDDGPGRGCGSDGAGTGESVAEVGDEGIGLRDGVDDGGDEADVGLDVGEGVRGEGERGDAGLEDGSE